MRAAGSLVHFSPQHGSSKGASLPASPGTRSGQAPEIYCGLEETTSNGA